MSRGHGPPVRPADVTHKYGASQDQMFAAIEPLRKEGSWKRDVNRVTIIPVPFVLRNISLGLDEPEEVLVQRAAKRLAVPAAAIRNYAIVRRSLDARRKDLHFNYHLEVALNESPKAERSRLRHLRPNEAAWIDVPAPSAPIFGTNPLRHRPVIVGFGPAGMFAALYLAENGYQPLVLERGRDVRRRHRDIMQGFYQQGAFDETSNLLFGEGGAGTYSDGKLYTRIHDPLCQSVLEMLYRHGADPDILIDSHPHIGSDRLPTICTRIRERIESLGGEVRFESQLADVRTSDAGLDAIRVGRHGCGIGVDETWTEVGPVLLAVGHSARDTIRMLHRRGVALAPRAFQLGVRIEHPQSLVDRWQYGASAGHRRLDPAEYQAVARGAACERGDLYSFCMCPGGTILPTNESAGLIATNGASKSQRSGDFANSGLVITLDPNTMADEFRSIASRKELASEPRTSARADEVRVDAQTGIGALSAASNASSDDARIALAGLAYQEHWERLAFARTGGTYRVPCQRASDFLAGRASEGTIETSYPLGGAWTTISDVIPSCVTDALHRALPMLASRFPYFAGDDAIITGPETRASAPFRIVRDPITRESVSCAGLYPIGEGAGYAGGIISAAVDGMKSAAALMARYAPPG